MSARTEGRHAVRGATRGRRLFVDTVLAGFPHLKETPAMAKVRRAERHRLISEAARAAAWQAEQRRVHLIATGGAR